MSKLIYAVLALAFAALVAGFVVSGTSLPLFVSIALSAVVFVLVLAGWTRRMREAVELGDLDPPSTEVEEIGEEAVGGSAAREPAPRTPARRRPARSPVGASGEAPVRHKPAAAADGRSARTRAPQRRVMVIPGRSRFHRARCRFAKGDQAREVSEATARRRGYMPCTICKPDQQS